MKRFFTVFFVHSYDQKHGSVGFGYDKFPSKNRIKEIIRMFKDVDQIVITNIMEMNVSDYRTFYETDNFGVFTDESDLEQLIKTWTK